MTDFTQDGFVIQAQDLSGLSPTSEDNHRVYNHDGTSTLTLTDGSTTSKKGWYMWSDSDSSWFPMGQHADLVDGYHGQDLAALAENEAVTGSWDFQNIVNISGGNLDLNANRLLNLDRIFASGDNLPIGTSGTGNGSVGIFDESNSQYLLEADEGGKVKAPNGIISSQGVRIHEGENHPLSISTTKWADGLSNEEVYRINVPTGKSLYAYSLDIQLKGGGSLATPSNLTVDLYDATNATQITSDSADGTSSTGNPLGSSGDGAEVLVRISNSSGSYQNASIDGSLVIK